MKTYHVILAPGQDGYLVATVPAIPGCISQGRTREEALSNIREAIELCLECYREEGKEAPPDDQVQMEVVKVAA